jgi:hypothetical protein
MVPRVGEPNELPNRVGMTLAQMPKERSFVMKLTPEAVEQTLNQFEAQALPESHPAVPQLNQLFGEHTYFLDGNGLHIVEPAQAADSDGQRGVVIKLASWSDSSRTSLAPHPPEPTDLVVVLKAA